MNRKSFFFVFYFILILLQACSQKGAQKEAEGDARDSSRQAGKKTPAADKGPDPASPNNPRGVVGGTSELTSEQKKSLEAWKLSLVKTCSVSGVFGNQNGVVMSGSLSNTPAIDLGIFNIRLGGLPQFVFGEPEGFAGEMTTTQHVRSQTSGTQTNGVLKTLELQTVWKDKNCTVKVGGQVVVERELAPRLPLLAFFSQKNKVVNLEFARNIRKSGGWTGVGDASLVQTLQRHLAPDLKAASEGLKDDFASQAPGGTPVPSSEDIERVLYSFGKAPGQSALLWSFRLAGGSSLFSNFLQPEWIGSNAFVEKTILAQGGIFEIEALARLPKRFERGGQASFLRVLSPVQVTYSGVGSSDALERAKGKIHFIDMGRFERQTQPSDLYPSCVLERAAALKAFGPVPSVSQVFSPCLNFSPSVGVDSDSPAYLGRMLSTLFGDQWFFVHPESELQGKSWSQFLLSVAKTLRDSGRDFRKELDPESRLEVVQKIGRRLDELRNIQAQAAGLGLEKWAEETSHSLLLANSSESRLQTYLRALHAAKDFVARDNHSELWRNDPFPDGKHRARQTVLLMAVKEGWDSADFTAVEKLALLARFHSSCRPPSRPTLSTSSRVICSGMGSYSKLSGMLQPKFNGRYFGELEKLSVLLQALEDKRDPGGIAKMLLLEVVAAYFPQGRSLLWGTVPDALFLTKQTELLKKLEEFNKESQTAKLGEIRLAILTLLSPRPLLF